MSQQPFPSLKSLTTALAVPGNFWASRSSAEQKALVRQLSLLALPHARAGRLAGIADRLTGGRPAFTGFVAWKPAAEDILVQGAGPWGVATLTFPSRKPGDTPVKALSLGVVPAGYESKDAVASYRGGYLLWETGNRFSGAPVFYSAGHPVEATTGSVSNRVTSLFTPDRAPVLGMTGSYHVVAESSPDAQEFPLPGIAATADPRLEFGTELSSETVWFVKLPDGRTPDILFHKTGWLARGTGFIEASGWLALYENPLTLWPDGIITGCAGEFRSSHPRSFALGDTEMRSSGRHVAVYKATDSGVAAFGRALAEVAGLPVLDAAAVVTDIHKASGRFVHRLDGGGSFSLPAATPYHAGDTVPAGTGHLLHVRSKRSHGPGFCAGRPWSTTGFDISAVYPQFGGIAIREESVQMIEEEGVMLPLFNQNTSVEEAWRKWFVARSTVMSGSFEDLDTYGAVVNPLELFAELLGERLLVVETPLQWVDPAAHARVADFISRERPAGAVVVMPAWPAPFTYESGIVFEGYQLVVGDSVLVWA